MWFLSLSNAIAKVLMVLAAMWAFVLCFVIVADVVGRGVFDSPLQGTPEIVANSIVMIVFLQAGYAIRSGSMLRAEFLVKLFGNGARRVVLGIGYFLGIVFFAVMFWGAIDLAVHSWVSGEYEGEGALRVPSWPTRFIILIGSLLGIVNYLALTVEDVFLARPVTSHAQSGNAGPDGTKVERRG